MPDGVPVEPRGVTPGAVLPRQRGEDPIVPSPQRARALIARRSHAFGWAVAERVKGQKQQRPPTMAEIRFRRVDQVAGEDRHVTGRHLQG